MEEVNLNMEVKVEHLGPIKKKIDVVIPPERVNEEVEALYKHLKKTIRIKGFRSGKVPESLLRKYYKEQVEEEAITKLIQDSYPEALRKVSMRPISQPVLENGVLEEGKEFFYSASFEIKPEIELRDYQALEVETEKVVVTQEEIERKLALLRESHACLKEVEEDRPLRVGDYALVDIKGSAEGRTLEGVTFNDHLLEVGQDSLLPGLSSKLIGLPRNTFQEFLLTLPEDYHLADLAGRKVVVQVRIKGIKEKILPPLDDRFARDVAGYKGVEELKKGVQEAIEKDKHREREALVRRKIEEVLLQRNIFEVPPSMVERHIEFMMADTQRVLLSQGSSLEQLGIPLDAMKENFRAEADRQVRCSLLYEKIAEKEGITVSDEEIEQKLKEIAQSSKQSLERVREFYKREGLWEGLKIKLLEDKTYSFLRKGVKLVEIEPREKS